MINYHLQLH